MSSQPVSYVKAHLAEVLESVRTTHQPLLITQNGEGAAVLQDVESYERTRKALGLLKLIAMGEADIQAGRVEAQDAVFARLAASLPGAAPRGRR